MSYDPDLNSLRGFPLAQKYINDLYNHSFIQEWISDAKSEDASLIIPQYEAHSD